MFVDVRERLRGAGMGCLGGEHHACSNSFKLLEDRAVIQQQVHNDLWSRNRRNGGSKTSKI